ncbi:hypothetical protein [Aquimarina rhabdastrellae]
MKGLFLFFIILLQSFLGYTQNTLQKDFSASSITHLEIALQHAYFIEISTTQTKKITISSNSDGEFGNQISVKTKITNHILSIEDFILPFTNFYDDKLNAHKVTALKLKITIPENLHITLNATYASAKFSGTFDTLFVQLSSGNCILNPFIGNAIIYTMDGFIDLHTSNATIESKTTTGFIQNIPISGAHNIILKTVTGNINVSKIK